MSQDKDVAHLRPAQVQVPVLHAQQLVDFALLVDVEGRRLGLVQHLDLLGGDVDLAGRHLGVLRSLWADLDLALDLDNPFDA